MNLPNEIKATFNRNIVLGVGTLKVFKDGSLFLTFNQNDIVVTDNYFTIDITNLFPENGNYYILMDEGLITSIFGESFSVLTPDVWSFRVRGGDYSSTHYSSDYFIN